MAMYENHANLSYLLSTFPSRSFSSYGQPSSNTHYAFSRNWFSRPLSSPANLIGMVINCDTFIAIISH